MKYRRKTNEFDAYQYIASEDINYKFWELSQYFGEPPEIIMVQNDILVRTKEDIVAVQSMDWVVRNQNNEYAVYKSEVFESKFEYANETKLEISEVEVQKLHLKPEEFLIVKIKSDNITQDSMESLGEGLRRVLNSENIIVLGVDTNGSIDLTIVDKP